MPESWLDPAVTRRVLAAHRDGVRTVPTAQLAVLTPREREVLVLIGSGLTNAEIAAALVLGGGHRQDARRPRVRQARPA